MHIAKNLESSVLGFLDRIPVVSFYAKTRGWPYVIAWCHRIAGFILVAYMWFHTYTLLSLSSPPLYDATMKVYGSFLFTLLEWALAIPVIFHALNGGRVYFLIWCCSHWPPIIAIITAQIFFRQDNWIDLIFDSCKSSNYPDRPFLALRVSDWFKSFYCNIA